MSCLPVSHRSGLGNSPDANDGTTELRTSPPAQRHCSPVPGPGWLRPAPRHPGVAPRRAASLCPAAALANSLENRLSYSPPGNRSRRRPGVRAARRSPAPRRVAPPHTTRRRPRERSVFTPARGSAMVVLTVRPLMGSSPPPGGSTRRPGGEDYGVIGVAWGGGRRHNTTPKLGIAPTKTKTTPTT